MKQAENKVKDKDSNPEDHGSANITLRVVKTFDDRK
jgi:hypothetical protein